MKTTKSRASEQRAKTEATSASGRTDRRRVSATRRAQPVSGAAALRELGPRIEHQGLLARGGMGEVHRVFDRHIRRHAAMKVLDEELAAEPRALRRFLAEAQIAGQLDHPNIVPVYDLDLTEDGTPRQFTMKLVDGVTLTSMLTPERIAKRSDGELWELLNAFVKVCDAVAFAHSRGVVHCDLKPDNVMLGSFGQVYVMDWGIARVIGTPASGPGAAVPGLSVEMDDDEEPGTILGTAPYMAHEQAWGNVEAIDARTDVFALGGILYHMLTGHPPYEGKSSTAILKKARLALVRAPSKLTPAIPISPSLERIAMKALSRAPEHRYQSVEAMKRDVERALRAGLSFELKVFAEGEVILREGEAADAAYVITDGRASAYKRVGGAASGSRDAAPESRPLREMGPGEVFGEMALLADRPRTASVVAKTEVSAIVVTPEALARELHAESWLAALVRTLVDRLCDLDAQVHASRTSRKT